MRLFAINLIAIPGGRRCGCGHRGCFEAYASRTAIEEIVRERMAEGRDSAVPEIMAATGSEAEWQLRTAEALDGDLRALELRIADRTLAG